MNANSDSHDILEANIDRLTIMINKLNTQNARQSKPLKSRIN